MCVYLFSYRSIDDLSARLPPYALLLWFDSYLNLDARRILKTEQTLKLLSSLVSRNSYVAPAHPGWSVVSPARQYCYAIPCRARRTPTPLAMAQGRGEDRRLSSSSRSLKRTDHTDRGSSGRGGVSIHATSFWLSFSNSIITRVVQSTNRFLFPVQTNWSR